MGSEEELQRLAKEELLRDAKLASMRAEHVGAHGWAKPQKLVANKRFLKYMLFNMSREQREVQRHKLSRMREEIKHRKEETPKSEKVFSPNSHKEHSSKQKHDLKRSKSRTDEKRRDRKKRKN